MRNVGTFEAPFRVENEIPAEIQIPKMIEVCKKYNVLMKAHNTDYLSNEALKCYPRLGINAANIAPEFGVTESKKILQIMKKLNLESLKNEFIKLSIHSNKWKKWLIKGSKISLYEKAIISGHYVFSDKKFAEIKNELSRLLKKNQNLDKILKRNKGSILRYLNNFNLIIK